MSVNDVEVIEICDEKENILKEKKKCDGETNNNNTIPNDEKEKIIGKTGL